VMGVAEAHQVASYGADEIVDAIKLTAANFAHNGSDFQSRTLTLEVAENPDENNRVKVKLTDDLTGTEKFYWLDGKNPSVIDYDFGISPGAVDDGGGTMVIKYMSGTLSLDPNVDISKFRKGLKLVYNIDEAEEQTYSAPANGINGAFNATPGATTGAANNISAVAVKAVNSGSSLLAAGVHGTIELKCTRIDPNAGNPLYTFVLNSNMYDAKGNAITITLPSDAAFENVDAATVATIFGGGMRYIGFSNSDGNYEVGFTLSSIDLSLLKADDSVKIEFLQNGGAVDGTPDIGDKAKVVRDSLQLTMTDIKQPLNIQGKVTDVDDTTGSEEVTVEFTVKDLAGTILRTLEVVFDRTGALSTIDGTAFTIPSTPPYELRDNRNNLLANITAFKFDLSRFTGFTGANFAESFQEGDEWSYFVGAKAETKRVGHYGDFAELNKINFEAKADTKVNASVLAEIVRATLRTT